MQSWKMDKTEISTIWINQHSEGKSNPTIPLLKPEKGSLTYFILNIKIPYY